MIWIKAMQKKAHANSFDYGKNKIQLALKNIFQFLQL
jgi:hypothetical protein